MTAVDELNFLADIVGEALPHLTINALRPAAVARINAAFGAVKDALADQAGEIDKLKHLVQRQQEELNTMAQKGDQ